MMASENLPPEPEPEFPETSDDARLLLSLLQRLALAYPEGVPKGVLFAAFQHAKGIPLESW